MYFSYFTSRRNHYVWFSWFWSHFFLQYVYSGSSTITSKAKINIFWKAKIKVFWNFFIILMALFCAAWFKNFQKIDFSHWEKKDNCLTYFTCWCTYFLLWEVIYHEISAIFFGNKIKFIAPHISLFDRWKVISRIFN